MVPLLTLSSGCLLFHKVFNLHIDSSLIHVNFFALPSGPHCNFFNFLVFFLFFDLIVFFLFFLLQGKLQLEDVAQGSARTPVGKLSLVNESKVREFAVIPGEKFQSNRVALLLLWYYYHHRRTKSIRSTFFFGFYPSPPTFTTRRNIQDETQSRSAPFQAF